MGMSWILEVISAVDKALDEQRRVRVFWIISDTFNALLGVFIFIIFVCKGRVLKLIKKRLGNNSYFKESKRKKYGFYVFSRTRTRNRPNNENNKCFRETD